MQITIREPGSAITHFIGMMMAVFAAIPLLVKTAAGSSAASLASMSIFILSMILLYGASATYHSINVSEKVIKVFRKIDHMMIFILIAGSYTPVCMIVLGGKSGYTLLAIVWGIAAVGIGIKAFWITCPKWFSSIIYIAMGWVCIGVFGPPVAYPSCQRIPVAPRRRYHLHNRRHYLRAETPYLQLQTCQLWLP